MTEMRKEDWKNRNTYSGETFGKSNKNARNCCVETKNV